MSTAAMPLIGHLDAALTNFAKGFSPNELVGDRIAPRVGVSRQSDKYWIWGREAQQVKGSTLRAPGAPAPRTRLALSNAAYYCQSHAQALELPDETGVELPALRQGRTQFLTRKILLDKEIALAAILTDIAKVTRNVTLAGATQFSDPASDPIGVIEDAKNSVMKSGQSANTLILPPDVIRALKKHAAVADRLKYTKGGAVTLADLAAVFDIERVLPAAAVTVDDAGTESWVWGKHVLVAYVQDTPGQEDCSLAKTFVWQGAPGTIGGIGTVIGRHPDPTAKSEITGVDFYYDQQVTAVEGGYLIKNAVA